MTFFEYDNIAKTQLTCMNKQCPLTPMGVLALGSSHAKPSTQPPIDMSGNFPAHVSAESPSKFSKKN